MIEILEKMVIEWGESKEIFAKSNPAKQAEKTCEEAEELLLEIMIGGDKKSIQLEIGDVLVTAILQCKMQNTSLEECLSMAYNKISKRTGNIVDGLFVKDGA